MGSTWIKLTDAVSEEAKREFDRSMKMYPLFSSKHEGYAVIKEEIEEAKDAMHGVDEILDIIWNNHCKGNLNNVQLPAKRLRALAVDAAAELIQVAAMAEKLMKSESENYEG